MEGRQRRGPNPNQLNAREGASQRDHVCLTAARATRRRREGTEVWTNGDVDDGDGEQDSDREILDCRDLD